MRNLALILVGFCAIHTAQSDALAQERSVSIYNCSSSGNGRKIDFTIRVFAPENMVEVNFSDGTKTILACEPDARCVFKREEYRIYADGVTENAEGLSEYKFNFDWQLGRVTYETMISPKDKNVPGTITDFVGHCETI